VGGGGHGTGEAQTRCPPHRRRLWRSRRCLIFQSMSPAPGTGSASHR
jgi:hypothetical protein